MFFFSHVCLNALRLYFVDCRQVIVLQTVVVTVAVNMRQNRSSTFDPVAFRVVKTFTSYYNNRIIFGFGFPGRGAFSSRTQLMLHHACDS